MTNLLTAQVNVPSGGAWQTLIANPAADEFIRVFSVWPSYQTSIGNQGIAWRELVSSSQFAETGGGAFGGQMRNLGGHFLNLPQGSGVEAHASAGGGATTFAWIAYTVQKGGSVLLPNRPMNLTPAAVSPAIGGAFTDLVAGVAGRRVALWILTTTSISGNHAYEYRWAGTAPIIAAQSCTPSVSQQNNFGGHFLLGPVGAGVEASATSGGGANGTTRAYYSLV
jgi:hypothetical protein